ncbi:MAG: hypothetical protein K9L68_03855 [Spirochaetales bacterium]|nr:hypothetical protein [Spirochaetales bacterium]MCF7937714.1 hypothetical protein [Spirochaetales bacterium]
MSDKNDNMLIADTIKDQTVRDYFYLDLSLNELIDKMCNLQLQNIGDDKLAPFWAKVRGYTAGMDNEGNSWLIKEIPPEEGPAHKTQEIAFYMDFLLKTPAAPTVLLQHGDTIYRATKQITNAMQIGSYNYLQEPFIKMLANDLINRWLFFDEDRNPNNYLVKHDTDGEPFIIVIDYNKADLETEDMKIFGLEDRFGWHREEKTRFLTLLKPENFEGLSIEDFEQRLSLMTSIEESTILEMCRSVFSCGIIEDTDGTAQKITRNLLNRIDYLDTYFRKWFKKRNTQKEKEVDDRYSGLGQSFLDYYKRKT